MIFNAAHEVRGPYWIFTNLAVETGIMTCRVLLEFLEAKQPRYPGDVLIKMFQRPNGKKLSRVPLRAVAKFHPPELSESNTIDALEFTKLAADKAVAHLTLGPPQQEGEEIQLYQISCLAIRAAIEHHLYEQLGLPAPPKIFEHFTRGELEGS
jgi:hypothetical protein